MLKKLSKTCCIRIDEDVTDQPVLVEEDGLENEETDARYMLHEPPYQIGAGVLGSESGPRVTPNKGSTWRQGMKNMLRVTIRPGSCRGRRWHYVVCLRKHSAVCRKRTTNLNAQRKRFRSCNSALLSLPFVSYPSTNRTCALGYHDQPGRD